MDGKNFINTEKKYLSNLKDLIKNNKIKEAIKVLNEVEKKGFSEVFINNLIYLLLESKLKNQENVGSFFDGLIIDEIKRGGAFSSRAHSAFRNFLNSKENRFIDFESRSQENCNISNQNRTSEMSVVLSQGTHSVFHWKNYIAFKSVFDLAIYSMLITELKPNIIIEIGSGKGGSAIWLADMMKILGLEPKVYSYDINKLNINYSGVNFFQFDLNNLNNKEEFPKNEDWTGVKLVIEDAHVNIPTVLKAIDDKLNKGDYFVVEDSDVKQKELKSFILKSKNNYLLDKYFLDFFGRNGTSAKNSIFKIE